MLTPGEYVLNKQAVKNIGVDTLNKLNFGGVQKFADGGPTQLTPFSRGDSNRRLLEEMAKINKLLGDNFGLTINDIVGNNVFTQEGLTNSKGISARGKFTAGGSQGSLPPNSIVLNPRSAGGNTILEEALHGIDFKSSTKAKDFVPTSAIKNNPLHAIGNIFKDEIGQNALAAADDLNIKNADIAKYLSQSSERAVKPIKHILRVLS